MGGKKVVVGMSGGVDSSVAALLLKEQGYDVIGVTMQIWNNSDTEAIEREGGCCGQSAVDDAARVAEVLGIPHYVMDFRGIFEKKVIDYFVGDYIHGRTPNPCIACNRYVKWEALLTKSLEIGADFIATGHYARIELLSNGRYAIRNSVTAAKDQTYALYALTQFQLSHTLMPVGDYHKDEIRKMADEAGLPVAHKPDSQEICFVSDKDYSSFIEKNAGDRIPPEGRFVSEDGRDLGPNKGIIHYTIGQRKHLGLSMGHPVFVTDVNAENNSVVIGENGDVFGDRLTCSDICYMAADKNDSIFETGKTFEAVGKIRYAHRGAPCTVTRIADDRLSVCFEEKVRAITPGQALVLYQGEHILCGGTIERAKAGS